MESPARPLLLVLSGAAVLALVFFLAALPLELPGQSWLFDTHIIVATAAAALLGLVARAILHIRGHTVFVPTWFSWVMVEKLAALFAILLLALLSLLAWLLGSDLSAPFLRATVLVLIAHGFVTVWSTLALQLQNLVHSR